MAGALEMSLAVTLRDQLLIARSSGYVGPVSALPDKAGAIAAAARAFGEAGVAYALIGGLAVGVRSGTPRATLDVDFAIPTNVDRGALSQVMASHGFRLVGESAHRIDFEHTSGEPVQLAFDPEFDPMIARAESVPLGELQLPVVTKADLITMKKRAAADGARRRSKALRDRADVALLEGDVPEPGEGW